MRAPRRERQPERIRVGDVVRAEAVPEQQNFFETFGIEPGDADAVLRDAVLYLNDQNMSIFFEMAYSYSVVFSQERDALQAVLDECRSKAASLVGSTIRQSLYSDALNVDYVSPLRICAPFVALYPQDRNTVSLSDDEWRAMARSIDQNPVGDSLRYVQNAALFMRYFPEQSHLLHDPLEVQPDILKRIQSLRTSNTYLYCRLAPYYRLLYPDRREDLPLDEAFIEYIREEISMCRDGGEHQDLIEYAFTAAVLSADRIEMTPDGPRLHRVAPVAAAEDLPSRAAI